ncbi:hypothetical protein ACL02O_17710 [Micromonospora sp. MS34]|uniref:hypothetical protein n=1 Tax=Micromonospora sp. MS34 TaxID=3385971 RepID=UPI0039A0C427
MGKIRSLTKKLTPLSLAIATGLTLAATTASPARAGIDPPYDPDMEIQESATYWNGVLVETFRRMGGGPGPMARVAAIVHASIFDTANSAYASKYRNGLPEYDPYLTFKRADASVNTDLAMGYTRAIC